MKTGVGINLFDYVTGKQLGFINFREGYIEVVTAHGNQIINVDMSMDIPRVYNDILSAVYNLGIKYDGSRLLGDEFDSFNTPDDLYMLSNIPNINVMIMLCLLDEYDNYDTWNEDSILKKFRNHITVNLVGSSIHVLYDDILLYIKELDDSILSTKQVLDYICDTIHYRFTGIFNKYISANCKHKVIERPNDVPDYHEHHLYLSKLLGRDNPIIKNRDELLSIYTNNSSYRDYVYIVYKKDVLIIYALTDNLRVYAIYSDIPDYFKNSIRLSQYIWYLLRKIPKTNFNKFTKYSLCKFDEVYGSADTDYILLSLEQGCKQLLNPAKSDNSFDSLLERARIMMGN